MNPTGRPKQWLHKCDLKLYNSACVVFLFGKNFQPARADMGLKVDPIHVKEFLKD